MNNQITGTVVDVQTKSGTSSQGKEWTKDIIVLQTEGQYPKKVAVTNLNHKIQTPQIGENVTISVNIESREYNGTFYTDVQAWKVG
jgi:hypothetical protein